VFFIFTLRVRNESKLNIRLERLKLHKFSPPSWLSVVGLNKTREFLKTRFEASGFKLEPDEAFLWFVLFNTAIIAILIISGYTFLAVALPIILRFIGFHILDSLASKRIRLLEEQFRDFLTSLALHLKVTPSFQSALIMAAITVDKPLGLYIDRVITGLQGGESIESAISTLKAIPIIHVRTWTDSVIFAVRIKADLSRLCARSAERLGLKIRLAGKIYAQTAQSKALMISLGGMMLFMMVTTMSASPEFIEFYSSPLGRAVASAAVMAFIFSTLYVLKKIDKEMSN